MFAINVKLQKIRLLSIFLVIFLYSCANIQPPSGGPKDEIPPFVESTIPLEKTLNYEKDYVEIEFSEWVNRNQVLQNIMVSPVSEVSYKWSGRRLKVIFEKDRKPNTTYLISLGTEYSDNAGNKPDSAFSLTFSTGNTIDSGRIDGFVYNEKVNGAFIYAYRLTGIEPDTLNPEITPADYRTQLGNIGSFSLLGLPDGDYRIMAVKTSFRDNLFHPKSDEFGTFWEDVRVEQGKAKFVTMKFAKYPDYSPILINSISKIDSNRLLLEFNKLTKINSSDISLINIQDSAKDVSINIKNFYLDSIYSKKLIINTTSNIENISTIKLFVSKGFLKDTLNNENNVIEGFFKLYSKNFETSFGFNRMPIKDSTQNIGNIKEIVFTLNKSLLLKDSSAIQLKNTVQNKYIRTTLSVDGNALAVRLNEPLNPDEWYKMYVNTSKIISIENEQLSDTILVFNFKTEDWKQFPKVSGKLLDSVMCSKKVVLLKSKQSNNTYQALVENSNDWSINEVKPDKYIIEIYCDENGNEQYDYGKSFPYKHSEKFLITKQEIEVKPRWEVKNILLLFKLN